MVTIDTAVAGMRERDPRNGVPQLLGNGAFAKLPFLPNLLLHPGWLMAFLLDGGVPKLENVVVPGKGPLDMVNVSESLSRGAVSWKDLSWIRECWSGPIVIKGLLIADDARRAVDEGASAVVVSNHGGRQLDSVSSTIRALPEVVRRWAIRSRFSWMVASDVAAISRRRFASGARAVLVGRAYAYGLAAAGYSGVERAIQILKKDFERTMRLLGCQSVSGLDASYINYPREWRDSFHD